MHKSIEAKFVFIIRVALVRILTPQIKKECQNTCVNNFASFLISILLIIVETLSILYNQISLVNLVSAL